MSTTSSRQHKLQKQPLSSTEPVLGSCGTSLPQNSRPVRVRLLRKMEERSRLKYWEARDYRQELQETQTWDEVTVQVRHCLMRDILIIRCMGRRCASHGCGSSGTFVPSRPRCFFLYTFTHMELLRFRYCHLLPGILRLCAHHCLLPLFVHTHPCQREPDWHWLIAL